MVMAVKMAGSNGDIKVSLSLDDLGSIPRKDQANFRTIVVQFFIYFPSDICVRLPVKHALTGAVVVV